MSFFMDSHGHKLLWFLEKRHMSGTFYVRLEQEDGSTFETSIFCTTKCANGANTA